MLSQQELADLAGVSLFTVQRIERGEGSVRPKTGRAIAEALGVRVEDLLGKAQAPLPDFEDERRTPEAFEQALARILEPVRTEALREQQAANRLHASGGIPQSKIGDLPEAEAARRFVGELSPEERPVAFGEVALGYARLERKLAQLEEENARLREARREEVAVFDERAARVE